MALKIEPIDLSSIEPQMQEAKLEAQDVLRQENPGLRFKDVSMPGTAAAAAEAGQPPPPAALQWETLQATPKERPAPPPVTPEEIEDPNSTIGNLVRGIGERAAQIVSWVPQVYKTYIELQAGNAAGWDQNEIPDAVKQYTADVGKFAQTIKDVDLGYKESVTPVEIKQSWSSGDKLGAAKQLAGYGLEQGIISLPDMVAILTAAPVYYIGLSADYAQERAKNDGRTMVNAQDVAVGASTAAIVATLEKYGAEQVFGVGGKGAKGMAGQLLELLRRGASEAATEMLQNPVEFVGIRLGTRAADQVTAPALGEQALFGAAGGFGGGVAISAPVQAVQAFANRDRPQEAPPQTRPAAPPGPAAPPSAAPPAAATPAAAPPASTPPPSGKPASLKEGDVSVFYPSNGGADPSAVRVLSTGKPPGFATVVFLDSNGEPVVLPDGKAKVAQVKLTDLDVPTAPAAGKTAPPASPAATPVAKPLVAGATPPAPVAAAPVSAKPAVSTTPVAANPLQESGSPTATGAQTPGAPAATGADPGIKAAFDTVNGGATTDALYDKLVIALDTDSDTVAGVKDPLIPKLKPYYEAGLVKTGKDARTIVEANFPPIEGETAAAPAKPAAEELKPLPIPPAPKDDIYDKAVNWLEKEADGVPSLGALRTKFGIGGAKASKLMNQLEKNGVVALVDGKRVVPNRLPEYAQPETKPEATVAAAAEAAVVRPEATAEKKAAPPKGPIGALRAMVDLTRDNSFAPKAEGSTKIDIRQAATDMSSVALVLRQATDDAIARGAAGDVVKSARELTTKLSALGNLEEADFRKARGVSQDKLLALLADVEAITSELEKYADKEKAKEVEAEKPKVETKKKPKVEAIKEKSKAKEEKPAEEKKAEPPKQEPKAAAPDVALKAAGMFKKINEIFEENDSVKDLLDALDETLGKGWRDKIDRTMDLKADALTAASDQVYGKSMSEDTEIDTSMGTAAADQGVTPDEIKGESLYVDGQEQQVKKSSVKILNKRTRTALKPRDRAVMPILERITQWLRRGTPVALALRNAKTVGEALEILVRRGGLTEAQQDLIAKLQLLPDVMASKFGHSKYTSVKEALFLGGRFYANENKTTITWQAGTNVVLHEISHAATVYTLYDIFDVQETETGEEWVPLTDGARQLLGLMNRARREIRTPFYGFTNPVEFIAEAMTNPRFRRALNAVSLEKAAPTTLWGKIKAWIAQQLGIEGKGLTALDAALDYAGMAVAENAEAREILMSEWAQPEGTLVAADSRRFSLRDRLRKVTQPRVHNSPGHFRIEALTNPEVAKAVSGVLALSKTGIGGKIRRSGLGFWTNDFIVRWGKRFFDSSDATNPLTEWKFWEDRTRSFANNMREKAEPILATWNKMSKSRSDQVSDVMLYATDAQLDPRHPLAEQRSVISRRVQLRYDELVAKWNALDAEQQKLFADVQTFYFWRFNEVRKAGVDLALTQFGQNLNPTQRTMLYAARTDEQVDRIVGDGKLIDLGDTKQNTRFRETLRQLVATTTVKGPYFPLKRHGDHVLTAQREQEWIFPTVEAAKAKAREITTEFPSSTIKVKDRGDGTFRVYGNFRYVSFHGSEIEAQQESKRMSDLGFKMNPITLKIQDTSAPLLGKALGKLLAAAQKQLSRDAGFVGTDAAGRPLASEDALAQTLQLAFTHLMAERASVQERMQRKGYAGYKIEEAKQSFAESVQGGAWHYAHLRTSFGKAQAISRLRHFMSNPEVGRTDGTMTAQDVMLTRGRLVNEIDQRVRLENEEYSKPMWGRVNQVVGSLGFLNFLASPAYVFINSTQNLTVGLPVMTGKYGPRGARIMGRAMKLVAGPTFRESLRGFFSKPGDYTPYDVYQAIAQAIQADVRFGKWTQPGPNGAPSALQQLVDRGTVNASYVQELTQVINAQGDISSKVMDWARLLPQSAEMFNRLAAAIAMLEVTNGDVNKAADFVDEVHFNYNQENRPRFFRKVGGFRIPQAATMFKMYGIGIYQLVGSLAVDMVQAKTRSRVEAAKTLAMIMVPHLLFAGLMGSMFEPLQWLIWMFHSMFSDEPYDLNQMIRGALKDMGVESDTMRSVLTRGLPNAAGVDLSGNMGLNRLLLPDPGSFPENPSRTEAVGWFAEQLLGPWPPALYSKASRASGLMDQGHPVEALMTLVPIKAVDNAIAAYQLADRGLTTKTGAPVPGGDNFNMLEIGARAAGFRTTKENRDADKARYAYKYREAMTAQKTELVNAYARATTPAEKAKAISKIQTWMQEHPGQRVDLRASLQGRDRAARERSGDVRDPVLRERLSE